MKYIFEHQVGELTFIVLNDGRLCLKVADRRVSIYHAGESAEAWWKQLKEVVSPEFYESTRKIYHPD